MKINKINRLALINGYILDGSENMEPAADKVILIEGDTIKAITDRDEWESSDTKQSYEVYDLNGRYVMPGLINMHVHLAGNGKPQKKQRDNAALVGKIMSTALTRRIAYNMVKGFAKLELLSGVTTIRTVGGLADFDTRCRTDIENGRCIGPRIIAANEGISVPGGHMAGSVAIAATTIDEALAQVDRAAKQKVDIIKLMITGGVLDAKAKGVPGELKMQPDMINAVCGRAHKLGYKVAAHVESTEGVRAALANGVDSIEHGARPDEEIISLFKEKNAFLTTTISPALPYALFDRSISHASEVEQFNGNIVFEGIVECSKAAIANGIPVALGNDVGCPYITQYDFWRELYYFSRYVGVSNAFALHTATQVNAGLAGIGNITGTVAPGMKAELIVTQDNPLDNLCALRNVDCVMAGGNIIDKPEFKRNANVDRELDKMI